MPSKFAAATLCLLNLAFAQEYKLDLFTDQDSQKYVQRVKNEVRSLLLSGDSVVYNVALCGQNCAAKIGVNPKFLLLRTDKELAKTKNSAATIYDNSPSRYEEDKLVRTAALTIYELLKEKKTNYVYIKNLAPVAEETQEDAQNKLGFKELFEMIQNGNISVKQNQNNVLLRGLDVDEAKTDYKPHVSIFSNFTQIDEDRAKNTRGMYSQGALDAGVKISQLVFSDKVLKNIEIKKLISKSAKDEAKALNDEIAYKAALLYLNILKTEHSEKILKTKRDFVDTNLRLAKDRVDIGSQDRSDVFRWESEQAGVNIDIANLRKELNSLKISLANLLDTDAKFSVRDYDPSELFLLAGSDAIKFLTDERVQKNFIESAVFEHPNLERINSLIGAKEEELKMNKASRYMPVVSVEASAKKYLDRYGEGKDSWNENEYQAVLSVSIPLYEGGLKSNKIQKNQIELVNLRLGYADTRNLILENTRKNLESLKSSYENISYAKDSQEASRKNFELVLDKYKNGKANIIALLDAQNAYVISQQNLNISKTQYLADLCSIYFFAGKIDVLASEGKKAEFEREILLITKGGKQ